MNVGDAVISAPQSCASFATSSNRGTILIVDDTAFWRDLVSDVLQTNGFLTISAADGQAGLDQLETQGVDAIVVDYEMPTMNGLAFLKSLRAKPQWQHIPVLMLTASDCREVILEAKRYRLSGYVLKAQLTVLEILTRVNAALGTRRASRPEAETSGKEGIAPAQPTISAPHLVSRANTLQAICDLAAAKSLPGAKNDFLARLTATKFAIQELAGAIKQEPILAARVLQLAAANSQIDPEQWSNNEELDNMVEACRRVPIEQLKKLSDELATLDALAGGNPADLQLLRCWQHSFATAELMVQIVPRSDSVASGTVYLIGLLHNLPELLLRQCFPGEFASAVNFADQEAIPVSAAFEFIFGATAAEMIAELARQLSLPKAIFDPIRQFASDAENTTMLSASLSFANSLANALQFTDSLHAQITPILQSDCRAARIPGMPIDSAKIIRAVAENTKALCDTKSPIVPLVAKRSTHIWYVRHSAFAQMDPLENALRLLGKTTCSPRLPEISDLENIHGLIIAAPAPDTPGISADDVKRILNQSGRDLPVLYIIPPRAGAAPVSDKPSTYPVSLDQLSNFVRMADIH